MDTVFGNRGSEGEAMAHLSSSSFNSNETCVADSAPPAEICARIEALVKDFLRSLVSADPSISSLPLVCRTTKNTRIQEGVLGSRPSICLMHSTFNRQFTSKRGVKSFIRVWKLLQICYQLLQSGKRATQRELFYRLLSDPSSYTRTPNQVNDAIQDIVGLLKCTRQSLGIFASGKGLVVGRLIIQGPDGRRFDCSKMGSDHYNISGDINYLEKLAFQSDARYIIVVEKETVFQRLARDRFYQFVPSIIITGKGYPDLATRVTLHRLHQAFPTLSIFALVDWNPAGLAILCTYKFGSIRMGLETPHHVCDVKWLGLRHEDLKYVSHEAMLDLKGRDKVLAQSLLVSKMLQVSELLKHYLLAHILKVPLGCATQQGRIGEAFWPYRTEIPAWGLYCGLPENDFECLRKLILDPWLRLVQNHAMYRNELAHMIERGRRVELEALHANGDEFLGKFIADKIVQQDYI